MFDLENVRNHIAKVHEGKKQYFRTSFWDDISREVMWQLLACKGEIFFA